MTDSPKPNRHYKRASHVRFSAKQFTRIERDSIKKDKSIPSLLREKYFKGLRPLPLITLEDRDYILAELRRIGDVSEVAANKLTGAIWGSTTDDLKAMLAMLHGLWGFLSTKYCRCNPAPQPAT